MDRTRFGVSVTKISGETRLSRFRCSSTLPDKANRQAKHGVREGAFVDLQRTLLVLRMTQLMISCVRQLKADAQQGGKKPIRVPVWDTC